MHHYGVADRNTVHRLPQGRHDACELVSHDRLEHARRPQRWRLRGELVQVRSADAAVCHLDHDLARPRLRLRDIPQFDLSRARERHCLHDETSSSSAGALPGS